MKQFLSVRLIRQKSKQLNIPYQNLLIGCAREWVLEQLSSVVKDDSVLVRKVSLLGAAVYKTGIINTLHLSVSQELFEETTLLKLFQEAFEEVEVHITKEIEEYKVRVVVPVEQLSLPIDVYINQKIGKKEHIKTVSLRLCYENEKMIDLKCCNSEAEMSQFLVKCYEKMVLLTDMTILDSMYAYLKSSQLDGRYLQSCIEEQLEEAEITVTEENLQLFLTSMKSKVLKQRFQGYLRVRKRKDVTYDQVEQLLEKAYVPVLEAIQKKEIFLADWMPEVERYL